MLGSLRACLALGLLVGATAAAADSRPAVIELFTSQGCSSCPPADALLGELARRSGVLALSFHVKYWDELGWRDRLAIDAAAQRQTGYSRILGHSQVYTPQVILDGRSDFVGSDRGGIEGGLRGERTGVPVSLTTGDGELVVRLGGGQCLAPSDVLLVTYLRKAVSAIGRGENSGRTLQEFNVVRSIRAVGHWNGSPSSFRVSLSSLPGRCHRCGTPGPDPRPGPDHRRREPRTPVVGRPLAYKPGAYHRRAGIRLGKKLGRGLSVSSRCGSLGFHCDPSSVRKRLSQQECQ